MARFVLKIVQEFCLWQTLSQESRLKTSDGQIRQEYGYETQHKHKQCLKKFYVNSQINVEFIDCKLYLYY